MTSGFSRSITSPCPPPLLAPWLPLLLLVSSVGSWAAPAPAAGDHGPEATPPETPPSEASISERLHTLFEQEFRARLRLDPSFAHSIGEAVLPDRLTLELAPDYPRRMAAHLRSYLGRAEELEAEVAAAGAGAWSARDRVYLEAFRHRLRAELELLAFPEHLMPLMPGFGLPSAFARTAARDGDLRFEEAEDFRAWLGRACDYETWVDHAIGRLRQGMKRGITHPRPVVSAMVRELSAHADPAPGEGVFRQLAIRARELEAAGVLSEGTLARVSAAVEERVLPAYRRLRDFLAGTYTGNARDSLSLGHLAEGRAWYRARARYFTTTELEPEEIFALGEKESHRLLGQMRRIQKQLGGRELHRWERREATILGRFRELDRQVRERLPALFHALPEASLQVRPVEASRAAITADAFYQRPEPGGGRPGIFYVDTRQGFDMATAEVLFLHEALPGHHLQISLAQEQSDLPHFLRFGYFGAYIEGWALYAESLGDELGLYGDPVHRLGALRFALGRAGRLVGDVGLHHRGWARDAAERELRGRGLHWAAAELERYATMPGQALGYTVGAVEIRGLRKEAEKALGEDFDARDFHAALLGHGPLPLDVLRHEIRRWTEDRKNAGQAR
ncbi:MAG: DUF885 domain-containing protein [Holophagales bacterium]|nr:DUF885 domain-containing protein [Holophagales bacterium]